MFALLCRLIRTVRNAIYLDVALSVSIHLKAGLYIYNQGAGHMAGHGAHGRVAARSGAVPHSRTPGVSLECDEEKR